MRYLANLALIAICLVGPVGAADYYFSDCDAGYISGPTPLPIALDDSTGSSCQHSGNNACQAPCITPTDGAFTSDAADPLPLGTCADTAWPNTEAGPTNNWTSSGGGFDHNTYVDDYPNDGDTTYLQTASNGQMEVFTVDRTNLPGTVADIGAVMVVAWIKGTSAGELDFKIGVRINEVNYDKGVHSVGDNGEYGAPRAVFRTNPETGLAWTNADITALEIFIEAIDVPAGLPRARVSSIQAFVQFYDPVPSDAAVAGTIGNPWCLDPDATGIRNTFGQMMDAGAGTDLTAELAAGDTVHLCSGKCDGVGSARFNLERTGTANGYDYVVTPRVNGPITVKAYAGEIIILSGDADNDSIADAVESGGFLNNTVVTGRTGYTFKDLIFEKWKAAALFYLNGDPSGWTFDNIEARKIDARMWNVRTVHEAECDNQDATYVFKVSGLTGALVIKNSRFHSLCGFVHRNTVNDDAGASMLIDNNEYYNCTVVTNDFIGHDVTYSNNYIHDCQDGIGIEQNMQNVIIEDNTVACLGEYKLWGDGRCNSAIGVSNGQDAGGTTKNITIRRNRVFGTVVGSYCSGACPNSLVGYYIAGITFTATNNTESINAVIENNMVWHTQTWSSSDPVRGAAIGVRSNRSEVTIQNNTVYDSSYPLAVDGIGGARAYTIRNNLLLKGNYSGSNRVELLVGANAATSVFTNNNFHSAGGGEPVMEIAGTNYNCSAVPGYSANGSSGNICQSSVLMLVTGPKASWDLHLNPADTANQDSGVAGALDDRDKELRVGVTDIGADETFIATAKYHDIAPKPPSDVVVSDETVLD